MERRDDYKMFKNGFLLLFIVFGLKIFSKRINVNYKNEGKFDIIFNIFSIHNRTIKKIFYRRNQ